MKPTRSDVRAVDPVLTNLLVGFMNAEAGYVANQAVDAIPVDSSAGTYFIFDKKYWFLDDMPNRAWGSDYATGGFGLSTGTYETEQYAKAFPIPTETRADSQVPMDLEEAGLQWLANLMRIKREREFAATYMTSGSWTSSVTGTSNFTKWSTYASSDPVGDVRTGKRTVSQLIGRKPNVMICGEIVSDKLANHPDIIDRIKYVQRANIDTVALALADLFGVEMFLEASAIYNTANEGQTASLSPIIDDDALLMYKAPIAGRFNPSAGYALSWAPGGGMGGAMPMYFDEGKDADVIKGKMQFQFKVVSADAGYFFTDAVDAT